MQMIFKIHFQTSSNKLTPKIMKFIFADFNINLLQNENFTLNENQSYELKNLFSPLVNKHKELCQTFSLTEIIKEPT